MHNGSAEEGDVQSATVVSLAVKEGHPAMQLGFTDLCQDECPAQGQPTFPMALYTSSVVACCPPEPP